MNASRWSFICFGLLLMGIACWKHFLDLLQWSQEISSSYFIRTRKRYQEEVRVWQIESNCGVRHICPDLSFPIYLSTASATDNQPKLCIAGKYVIKPKDKEQGRGLNAAIIETNHFNVISVRNFDTYLYNKSTEIAEWVDGIMENDILIIFTSDEASAKLTPETKALLNQLGSGKIQNLQYRSQWFMITQKGTPGFTTYEKITYSKKKTWGETIEFRGCIPKRIPKKITTADEPLKQNRKRAQFCEGKKQEKYKGFCNEPRFEIIMPALITNKSLLNNVAYTVPIFLFAGQNLEILISCLDNMIHQPGIVSSLINVLYESNTSDVPGLAKIYGVHYMKVKFGRTFEDRLQQIREISRNQYPKKKYSIVLDSEVIPSPDFLYFIAQTLPVLEKDNTVSTISGWSSNCYSHNGSASLTYRINGIPKYGALISVASNKSFFGDTIAPDVARLQGEETCHLPSLEPSNWIERPQDLLKDRYFNKMVMLQQLSQVIDEEDILKPCSHSAVKNETNVVYLQAKEKSLPAILRCLGILKNQYGEYNGVVRLFVEQKTVLIITKDSPFYKSRPIASMINLSKNDYKTSTQIGVPYSHSRTIMYEKEQPMKLPVIRALQSYKPGYINPPSDGYNSTYNEFFKPPNPDEKLITTSRVIKHQKEYLRFGKTLPPIGPVKTEYKTEYWSKALPTPAQGVSVEKMTTCPMVLTGKDEREALPLTENFYKYLDIYLSTSRLAHRAFTLREQRTIAAKNIVTFHETMGIPKGRGFGCKYPEFAGQDLDNRDKNMIDKAVFKTEARPRRLPRENKKVPNFGCESEAQASYKRPEGLATSHMFDKFVEFPQPINAPFPRQTLCAPKMYTTEYYVISNRTSPQTVV